MLLEIENKTRETLENYGLQESMLDVENEISYSRFIDGLNKAGVTVNRKMLSELAIDNPKAFSDLVAIAKDALNGKNIHQKK